MRFCSKKYVAFALLAGLFGCTSAAQKKAESQDHGVPFGKLPEAYQEVLSQELSSEDCESLYSREAARAMMAEEHEGIETVAFTLHLADNGDVKEVVQTQGGATEYNLCRKERYAKLRFPVASVTSKDPVKAIAVSWQVVVGW